MEADGAANGTDGGAAAAPPAEEVAAPSGLPEVEAYCHLVTLMFLVDHKQWAAVSGGLGQNVQDAGRGARRCRGGPGRACCREAMLIFFGGPLHAAVGCCQPAAGVTCITSCPSPASHPAPPLPSQAQAVAGAAVERLSAHNRRTLDVLAARIYAYLSLAHERSGSLAAIRSSLLGLHRTAVRGWPAGESGGQQERQRDLQRGRSGRCQGWREDVHARGHGGAGSLHARTVSLTPTAPCRCCATTTWVLRRCLTCCCATTCTTTCMTRQGQGARQRGGEERGSG